MTDRLGPEVYARAGGLIGSNLTHLIRNAAVVPHWVGGKDLFWYRRDLHEGHEFVLVDASTGTREPAFDHGLVAASLARVTGMDIVPDALPFDRFTYGADRASIEIAMGNTRYAIDRGGEVRIAGVVQPEGMLVGPRGDRGVTLRSGNLILHDLRSGSTQALTRDGTPDAGYGIHPDAYGCTCIPRRTGGVEPPLGTTWSPDGRWLIVPLIDQRSVEPYPFIESTPAGGALRPRQHQVRLPLVGERPAAVEWFVIDLGSLERRRLDLPTNELLKLQADLLPIESWWWIRDTPRVFAAAFGDTMSTAFLFDIDVASGKVRTVIDESIAPRADLNPTSYNPPNVWVDPQAREAIWYSQRDGWGHLYRYDPESGALRNSITHGDWLVRDLVRVDADAGSVYFSGSGREPGNPYHRYLYRASLDGSTVQLLTPEPADHLIQPARRMMYSPDGIEAHDPVAPSGRSVVDTYSTVAEPPRSVLRSTGSGEIMTELEVADVRAVYAAGWRAPEEFVVQAADGVTDLWGVMYTPPNLDPEGSYPVLDAQYAAPLVATAPRNFYQAVDQGPALSQAAYAELGFVVITVDGRGTTFRSKAFIDATWERLNTNGLEDHVAAIRQLADRHPFMDIGRVGIYGVSYGGYIAVRAMLEFPDFYSAAIATAPIAVMPGMYADYHWSAFHGRPQYPNGTDERAEPSEIPTNWRALDGRRQAANLNGHLFLQIGELDENVLPGQLMQFVDALIAENKDFEMLFLPGRDHYLMREGYLWRRNWDFMVRHLHDLDPPLDPPRIDVRTD